jgi:hypothetical protein
MEGRTLLCSQVERRYERVNAVKSANYTHLVKSSTTSNNLMLMCQGEIPHAVGRRTSESRMRENLTSGLMQGELEK